MNTQKTKTPKPRKTRRPSRVSEETMRLASDPLAGRAKKRVEPTKVTAEEVLDAATANAREVTKRLNKMESDIAVLRARQNRAQIASASDEMERWRWSLRGRAVVLGRDILIATHRALAPKPSPSFLASNEALRSASATPTPKSTAVMEAILRATSTLGRHL